jgi:hypothetical protein
MAATGRNHGTERSITQRPAQLCQASAITACPKACLRKKTEAALDLIARGQTLQALCVALWRHRARGSNDRDSRAEAKCPASSPRVHSG